MFRITSLKSQLKTVPLRIFLVAVLVCLVGTTMAWGPAANAADNNGFSLQVSPSPLVATVKPGETSNLQLHIRNTSSQSQALKMGLRAFTVDSTSGQVKLETTAPEDVASFVSFGQPLFNVEAGAFFDQSITIAVPASAGFTYSFAVTISQQHPDKPKTGTTAINGSVAVFTLLNVDKSGATRKVTLTSLNVSQHVYEYLPATVSVTLKNTGNTLAQPKGTIYIQRHSNDTHPLSVINLNSSGGYILPGSSRSLSVKWEDGFPHYRTVNDDQGKAKQQLTWQGNLSKLRMGKYVAKVVAVYNDGSRDVPLEAEVSFWVIPWRFYLLIGLFVLICVVGLVTIIRKSTKVVRRPQKHASDKKADK